MYILYLAYDTFTARLGPINKKSKKFKKGYHFIKMVF